MRTNLTATFIESRRAPEKGQITYWDTRLRGLGLRLSQGGARTWVASYRFEGRKRWLTLGKYPILSLADARELAKLKLADAMKGMDPAAAKAHAREQAVFGDLAAAYMERHSRIHKRPRSVADDEYYLAKYIPAGWVRRRLSSLTRNDIERLHATIGREHGPYAANHTVRLLRHMLNLARDWQMLQGENPASRVKLFKEQRRERYLTPEELARVNTALLQEPDWRWRAYFPLALMLGTRRTELCMVRWENVDLAQRTVWLPETKAGRPHLLPLPAPAIAILETVPSRGNGEWVFPSDSASGHIVEPAKAWQRIRKRAGVPDVRIHDLRHTLASWLVAQGFNLPLIGRALNHSQVSTTERYAHIALDPVRVALEQTAALMMRGPAESPASAK